MRRPLNEEEKKKVEFLFDYLAKEASRLREWDHNFLISIEEQYQKDGMLSEKQIGKLGEIFARY